MKNPLLKDGTPPVKIQLSGYLVEGIAKRAKGAGGNLRSALVTTLVGKEKAQAIGMYAEKPGKKKDATPTKS